MLYNYEVVYRNFLHEILLQYRENVKRTMNNSHVYMRT